MVLNPSHVNSTSFCGFQQRKLNLCGINWDICYIHRVSIVFKLCSEWHWAKFIAATKSVSLVDVQSTTALADYYRNKAIFIFASEGRWQRLECKDLHSDQGKREYFRLLFFQIKIHLRILFHFLSTLSYRLYLSHSQNMLNSTLMGIQLSFCSPTLYFSKMLLKLRGCGFFSQCFLFHFGVA